MEIDLQQLVRLASENGIVDLINSDNVRRGFVDEVYISGEFVRIAIRLDSYIGRRALVKEQEVRLGTPEPAKQ